MSILGTRGLSQLLFNTRIVASFNVKQLSRKGFALAFLLFAIFLHPLVTTLKAKDLAQSFEGSVEVEPP